MKKVLLAAAIATASQSVFAADSQIGRYTTESAKPTYAQQNLLGTEVEVKFPKEVYTVHEAIEYLLKPSGYRLAVGDVDPNIEILYKQVLPDVHRHIGTVSLADALKVLAGDVWKLSINPVLRTVTYKLDEAARAQYVGFDEQISKAVKQSSENELWVVQSGSTLRQVLFDWVAQSDEWRAFEYVVDSVNGVNVDIYLSDVQPVQGSLIEAMEKLMTQIRAQEGIAKMKAQFGMTDRTLSVQGQLGYQRGEQPGMNFKGYELPVEVVDRVYRETKVTLKSVE
ncbi:hypothetical protein THMIRHAS_16960 [Thiosulfatimonas sediminis]|uniref:Uncharacterized protein n=1 Tax=Thiosulfatimonas sediminis TaxID=2675054 RepID=A0A6F8PW04_9GAMM|nr:hypothetical protein [Thiosulfatimonas sediminis]BBP46323.1 hypothetical protein THMIRHAS_16960 [Thiosulfatimonas sediminis]